MDARAYLLIVFTRKFDQPKKILKQFVAVWIWGSFQKQKQQKHKDSSQLLCHSSIGNLGNIPI